MMTKPFALDALATKIRAMIEDGGGQGIPPHESGKVGG
jgi:DNA-binding response OmpR family regulator